MGIVISLGFLLAFSVRLSLYIVGPSVLSLNNLQTTQNLSSENHFYTIKIKSKCHQKSSKI